MKFQIPLHKHVSITAEVEADSPEDAIKKARAEAPGFTADLAVEILDGGEAGRNFEVIAVCENCDKLIFDGEKYTSCEDANICEACMKMLEP